LPQPGFIGYGDGGDGGEWRVASGSPVTLYNNECPIIINIIINISPMSGITIINKFEEKAFCNDTTMKRTTSTIFLKLQSLHE
jgi:hypothetical protein